MLLNLVKKLQERPAHTRAFSSSMFKGITVDELLKVIEVDQQDVVKITVNKEVYDENVHAFLVVDKVSFKQTLIKKEFKETITMKLNKLDDALRVMPETLKAKSSYGYVIKLDIKIKTE